VVEEIHIPTRDPRQFADVVGEERAEQFMAGVAGPAVDMISGRSIINVNSTGAGGGVAEMLRVLLAYARGVDLDARWLVIEGTAPFFQVTKRIHNHLYGFKGDGGPLGEPQHEEYCRTMHANLAEVAAAVKPDDIVILHDPQTAGLAADLKSRGAKVVWRCHVGIDEQNDFSREGWDFLRRYLSPQVVDAYVFTIDRFAPDWVPRDRLWVIPPSIDPFAPKNAPLSEEQVRGILATTGLVGDGPAAPVTFRRTDDSPGRIERGCDIIRTGPPPGFEDPLIVQISRWDHTKDMAGVLEGYADIVLSDHGSNLALVGPSVKGVADDPEGAQVLEECFAAWRELPFAARARIQLACVSMHDLEENAATINALQRHASVVVQKSLAEGFGLTVAEAMFKGTPVIGTRVGGITEQINHGVDGYLLDDPYDLDAFGAAVNEMLDDPVRLQRMSDAAREHATTSFLPDVHLGRWVALIGALLGGGSSPDSVDSRSDAVG
jgi:trehalose synthase